jgi:hypothetical protein
MVWQVSLFCYQDVVASGFIGPLHLYGNSPLWMVLNQFLSQSSKYLLQKRDREKICCSAGRWRLPANDQSGRI